jgi:hypothetical protein
MKKKDNIFKELVTDKKLPEASKEELIADIEALKLASELVDLFGSKYLSVIEKLFKTKE